METDLANPLIWAVSDGRAGNVAMAMGLAERVAGMTQGTVLQRDLEISGPRAWLAARFPRVPSRLQMASYPQPALVIGAGRRVAPAVAAMGKTGAKTVQILDPQMALRRFDLVVAPEHDGLSAPNAVATLGSIHRVTPARLAEARGAWEGTFTALPRPLIAVMIGGSTRRTPMTEMMAARLASDLRALSDHGAGLAITASRRTPDAHAKLIADALPDSQFWDGSGENPYFGMLACADAFVVTDDSVNMASETAATGKPLAIYPLLHESGKIAHFHERLIEAGHSEWFRGSIPTAHAAPLDETGKAAARIAALL